MIQNVKKMLGARGWEVLDRMAFPLERQNDADADDGGVNQPFHSVPRLLYFNTTSDTVNELRSLVQSEVSDLESCCALLDSHQGVEALEAINFSRATTSSNNDSKGRGEDNSPSGGSSPAYICSAVLYDAIFAEVRDIVFLKVVRKCRKLKCVFDALPFERSFHRNGPSPDSFIQCFA